jgi:hypothetical protein
MFISIFLFLFSVQICYTNLYLIIKRQNFRLFFFRLAHSIQSTGPVHSLASGPLEAHSLDSTSIAPIKKKKHRCRIVGGAPPVRHSNAHPPAAAALEPLSSCASPPRVTPGGQSSPYAAWPPHAVEAPPQLRPARRAISASRWPVSGARCPPPNCLPRLGGVAAA